MPLVPPLRPSFVLTRARDGAWAAGRVGMLYRDLIPDRQGGFVIASHIRIAPGPVPDYVHFHRVRFQLIYCLAGSVRVVYEDQGPPFDLVAGDAVLQPPEIRHRVLECSPGLEVLEVTCPAEHETHADTGRELPTGRERPDRDFGGQRFVRHRAASARYVPWSAGGFEARDLGLSTATGGGASVHAVRRARPAAQEAVERLQPDDATLLFSFVLAGTASLQGPGADAFDVAAGDAFVVPAGNPCTLRPTSGDFERLDVRLKS
jgi:quercetin dioxygenase-like cupin family protein